VVEEMTDPAGTVMAWQGPVRSTCDENWTTIAEGFASSDPEINGHAPDSWVTMGLGVGIVKAPEQPGTYVLVVEPVDEEFRRNDSWRIDSLIWRDNFMEIEVGGGVYLDEQFERYGSTIEVPEPRQVYVQAALDSAEPTLTLDVEYTDPDDQSTTTLSVTANRMGESGDGSSLYLSEPIGLSLEGQQKMAKSTQDFVVKVGGKLASRYLDRLIAHAIIENQGPVDLDIDSDNNNGTSMPKGSQLEENLETGGGYGKFVFVNHNDDDSDGVPDYANRENEAEGNFVPVVLKINIPDVNWSEVFVTFLFDGPTKILGRDYPEIVDPRLNHSYPTGFRDFRNGRRTGDETVGWKYPGMQLWAINDPSDFRLDDDLLFSGQTYTAIDLGFGHGGDPNEMVFYVEGLNQGGGSRLSPQPTTIGVEVQSGGNDYSDQVRLTVVEANLGVNNSSHEPFDDEFTNYGTLRPGIPDTGFVIDQYDEIVEDQGEGFVFWKPSSRKTVPPIKV
jgi:hypothetical protein